MSQIRGSLSVKDALEVDGASHLKGQLSVAGKGSFSQNLTVGGGLSVTGGISTGGGLSVSKDTTLSGKLTVGNHTTINANLTVAQNANIDKKLNVKREATLESSLTVQGTTKLNDKLTVDDNASILGKITAQFLDLQGNVDGDSTNANDISDDPNLADSSKSALVTEDAIKKYVDNNGGVNLTGGNGIDPTTINNGDTISVAWEDANDLDSNGNVQQANNADTVDGMHADEIISTATAGEPGTAKLGSRLNYTQKAKTRDDTIWYTRVFLREKTYNQIGIWTMDDIQTTDGDIQFGLYSDNSGQPDTLIEKTGVQTISASINEMIKINLQNSFTPSSAGNFWIAINNTINFDTKATVQLESSFYPVFKENDSGQDSQLPDPAGSENGLQTLSKDNVVFLSAFQA